MRSAVFRLFLVGLSPRRLELGVVNWISSPGGWRAGAGVVCGGYVKCTSLVVVLIEGSAGGLAAGQRGREGGSKYGG